MWKPNREDVAMVLSVLAALTSIAAVGLALQSRSDASRLAIYNNSISACSAGTVAHRKFYLQLMNAPDLPFSLYYPGELSSFEKSKIDLIDEISRLESISSLFESVSERYLNEIRRFDSPLDVFSSPEALMAAPNMSFAHLIEYSQKMTLLSGLREMPAEVDNICKEIRQQIPN